MIITNITGGLGNQMFQYAIAKSMAQKNKDIFKLDISFYPKQTLRKYELNNFNIDVSFATEKQCNELRGYQGILFKIAKKLRLPWNSPPTYIREKYTALFDEEIYQLQGNIYLDGCWQNEKYFIDIREELVKDFTSSLGISAEAQNYLKDIEGTNSVSLHIRRGDYVANLHTNSVHGVCGMDYYKRAIKYINNKVQHPIIYIFSDDIIWCKENFIFLENKIFVDNTKSAIDDLELMKRCKCNIIANSSFSWWAAWLNQNNEKIIVSPVKWIKNNPKNLKWVPDSWIQK